MEFVQKVPPMSVNSFNHNWSTMLSEICNGPWSPGPEQHSGHCLELADACSGTGVFSKFVEETFSAVRSVFGHEKTFIRNRMACEKDAAKQKFILAHHDPELMVADIVSLHHPTAADIRVPDQLKPVPKTDCFGSGFSCKDFGFCSGSVLFLLVVFHP